MNPGHLADLNHDGVINASVGYTCMNFTHDLERNLTAAGYNATFTVLWCYGPPPPGSPPATAHAVTDVHLADGRTVWIEPQTGRIINMDMDGDGVVETNNVFVAGSAISPTDDNCEIYIFDDRAAAQAAGVPGA